MRSAHGDTDDLDTRNDGWAERDEEQDYLRELSDRADYFGMESLTEDEQFALRNGSDEHEPELPEKGAFA